MENSEYAVCIGGEMYAFDIERIKSICLTSDSGKSRDQEIIENWEFDEKTQQPIIVSKVNREMKGAGNPQNDTIMYDLVKVFITTLLSADLSSGDSLSSFDFVSSIAFNTLLKEKIIYKL